MTQPTLDEIRATIAAQDAELAACAASVPADARFDESVLAAFDEATSLDGLAQPQVAKALPAFFVRA